MNKRPTLYWMDDNCLISAFPSGIFWSRKYRIMRRGSAHARILRTSFPSRTVTAQMHVPAGLSEQLIWRVCTCKNINYQCPDYICICRYIIYLARSANLLTGPYILPSVISSFFLIGAKLSQYTGPIITIFSPNGRYLREFSWSGPFFPILKDVAMATNLVAQMRQTCLPPALIALPFRNSTG